MSALDFAARLAGVPQKTIDEVNAAAPHTAKLLQTFKDHEDLIVQGAALLEKMQPVLVEAQPLLADALALYAKLAPLIGPALKEIDAISPAATDLIAFFRQQQQTAPVADGANTQS